MSDKEQEKQALRKKAEEISRTRAEEQTATPDEMSAEEVQRLLHELRVHQIELEMQNEELRRTQDELEIQRARYFDLYDLAPVGYCTVSEAGLLLEANLAAINLLGVTRAALIGQRMSRFILEEDQDGYYLFRKNLFASAQPQSCELRMVKKDESVFWAHLAATLAGGTSGAPVCRIVLRDISERKQAEKALKEITQRLQLATSSGKLGIWDWDLTSNNMTWDDRMLELYGLTRKTFPGGIEAWQNGLHPEDRDKTIEECQAALRGEKEWDTDFRVLHPDGTIKHIQANGVVIRDSAGTPVRMLGINFDITEKKRAEEALQASHRQTTDILESISDAFFSLDDNLVVTYFNAAAEKMLGRKASEVLGLPLFDAFPEARGSVFERNYQQAVREKQTMSFEVNFKVAPYENWFEVRVYPQAKGISVYFQTVTERKRLEEEQKKLNAQLHHAQKMEAIGTLAGGIAHDFNNILGAILGYAEMAQEDSPAGSMLRNDIDQVVKASHRAKNLVKQILAFSRLTETELIPMQPAIIVREAAKMLRSSLPSTIEIQQDIDVNTGPILADPTQIHQIVMNLGTNAFHAMEESGGILSISLERKTLAEKDIVSQPGLQPGEYVQLSIGDTGPGIEPALWGKIFDPYFTTKEIGKGTGMGLAIIHGIAKGYGGCVSFHSHPGEGTVFQVLLPVVAVEAVVEGKPEEIVRLGNERILFIDDEEILAEMGKSMLERLGYQVTVRSSSLEALTTFQNQPDMFDLVITDQTMPGMTGSDLARRILQIRPFMPIILCTGYSSLISEEKVRSLGIKGFAMKPLARKSIAVLIREVLDRGVKDEDITKDRTL